MNRYATAPTPENVGELRRRLAELGHPWTVDPDLRDEDPLPDHPRGGQAEEDVLEETRAAAAEPSEDLRELLAQQPPANPYLRSRWGEEGLLDPAEAEPVRDTGDQGGEPA
jgi:hypothetical protein